MRPLALVAEKILLREVDLSRRYLQVLRRVLLRCDVDLPAFVHATGALHLHPQLRARLRAECDADERDPLVGIACDQYPIAPEARAAAPRTRRG